MTEMFALAALWLALAILSTILANRLKVSMALTEICVGMAAGFACERWLDPGLLGTDESWLRFLAATGAVLLTFLAGAELEPAVLRSKAKEVLVVGTVGFLGPFLGCAAVARYLLGWDPAASWLAGVALSTTSMAVVYAVVIASAVIPTLVATAAFLPRHLLAAAEAQAATPADEGDGLADE